MINDYNNIKSRYTEAENTINKLNIRIKELENDISILKTNRTKSESKIYRFSSKIITRNSIKRNKIS